MSDARDFPSLCVSAHGLKPRGAFAEAQAAYLDPDRADVDRLTRALSRTGVGVVAHFYMDPELQGALLATASPHLQISDSLAMADAAVDMACKGAEAIVVLGVDFMAENVRAVLDSAGYAGLPVYRVVEPAIGCSLAESAQGSEYRTWLGNAHTTPRSLHVIYINTSLTTKADAQAMVPTISCTSSNVVALVLQAFHQIPDVQVWFGPDSYMGSNVVTLLDSLSASDDSTLRKLHPACSRRALELGAGRFRFFDQGRCIVHQLFGDEVARRVSEDYADASLLVHLEVPSALFRLGLEAQGQGRGIVGSTSDILGFVERQVDSVIVTGQPRRLRMVLGTESGMTTAIVRRIRASLQRAPSLDISVEIIFPVHRDAIAPTDEAMLPIVPGVAAGEGCSTEGGCASCPFMKMNSLDALYELLDRVAVHDGNLRGFMPRMSSSGSITERGTIPITHMRAFSQTGQLPDDLVSDVLARCA